MPVIPDVVARQLITADHINAVKRSVNVWVTHTDAAQFNLGNLGVLSFAPGGYVSGNFAVRQSTPAGVTVVDFLNPAMPAIGNAVRLRLGPSNGFLNGPHLMPYVEAYTDIVEGQYAGLAFGTYTGGAVAERMRIDRNGRVGIGTTRPENTLHVEGLDAGKVLPVAQLKNLSADPGTGAALDLTGTSADNRVGARIAGIRITGGAAHDLVFSVAYGDWTLREAMRINTNCYVGIGTANPLSVLHVKGHRIFLENPTTGDYACMEIGDNRSMYLGWTNQAMVMQVNQATMMHMDLNRIYQRVPNSAPTDSTIGNSFMSVWFDEANNRLAVRCKTSAGVLKTGYVPVS